MRKTRIGKKKASTAKIALIYTISNVITKGMAFLTTPIFSRMMSKEEYGQFSNIASWAGIFAVITTADLYTSISKAKYDFDKEIDEFMSSIMVLSNIITLCLYGIIESNMSFFENFFAMKAIYIRFLFLYMLFWPAAQFWQRKSQIYNRYKSVIAISGISLLLSTAASIILVMVLENKLLARVIGNYCVVLILYVVLWGSILIKGKSFAKRHCFYALKMSVPLILHNLAGNLLNSSDRIVINKFCGSKEAALYSLTYTVAMIVSLIMQSLNQAYVPWLYDKLHAKDMEAINRNSVVYISLFFVFATGVMLVAPEIVLILGGKEYYEARFVIAPVIIGMALQFVYTLYVNIELFNRKTHLISCATTLAAIINLYLNYMCVPKWGYIAAAYTTMVSYLFLLIFHYLIVRWKCKQYIEAYNKKMIVISLVLLSCMAAGCLFLYQHNIIRYIIILAVFIIISITIYMKREILMQKIRR